MVKRELTHSELLWCRRLARVLHTKPPSLEVYVRLNSVDVLSKGAMLREFISSEGARVDEVGGLSSPSIRGGGNLDKIGDHSLYSIITKITGDPSGL